MASGEICAILGPPMQVNDDSATLDFVTTGSTPASNISVLDFDTGSDEYAEFQGVWQNYASGGITVKFVASFGAITSGTGMIAGDLQIIESTDTPSASYSFVYTSQSDTQTAPGTATRHIAYEFDIADETGMTDGGYFILRLVRDVSGDTAAGDLELWVASLHIVEQ